MRFVAFLIAAHFATAASALGLSPEREAAFAQGERWREALYECQDRTARKAGRAICQGCGGERAYGPSRGSQRWPLSPPDVDGLPQNALE